MAVFELIKGNHAKMNAVIVSESDGIVWCCP